MSGTWGKISRYKKYSIFFLIFTFLGLILFQNPIISSDSTQISEQDDYLQALDVPAPFQQEWNRTWQPPFGSGSQAGMDVVMDGNNSIYVAGFGPVVIGNMLDFLLIKYNSTGHKLWERAWGGTWNEFCRSAAVDSNHSILLAGETTSFGSGGEDAFLVKYDSDGTRLWYVSWGGPGDDYATSVATDDNNNIYISGYTESFAANGSDVFIVKYNSTGYQLWNLTWDNGNYDGAEGMTIDDFNYLYLVGVTRGSVFRNLFLHKYDLDGNQLWNRTVTAPYCDILGYCIANDQFNNSYIGGQMFNLSQHTELVVKFDINGYPLWNQTIDGSRTYYDVVIYKNNCFFSGYNSQGAIISWYNTTGYHYWTENYGIDLLTDYGYGITGDNRTYYLSGYHSTLNGPLFIAKFTIVDGDADGIIDVDESIYGTDPSNPDTDGDLILDGWEIDNSLNPLNASDAALDFDSDNLTNLDEFLYDADPNKSDSDDDELPDGMEVQFYGTDPTNQDSDYDLMPDGWEVEHSLDPLSLLDRWLDPDEDGLPNIIEYSANTDPNNQDTDFDGLTDSDEIYDYNTDPTDSDTDNDFFPDGFEISIGGDPLDPFNPLIGFIILTAEIVSVIVLTKILIKIYRT